MNPVGLFILHEWGRVMGTEDKETNDMKIDVNTVIQKLANQIADLQLQVAILQAEKEALQRQLSEKQEENQNKNA